MSKLFSEKMDYVENLYDSHEGDIHYIMNNYDLDNDDWEYLMDIKEYRNE